MRIRLAVTTPEGLTHWLPRRPIWVKILNYLPREPGNSGEGSPETRQVPSVFGHQLEGHLPYGRLAVSEILVSQT